MPPIFPSADLGPEPPAAPVPAAQCRPTTLAGSLRVAVTRATRRLRLERSSEQITDGQYAALAALANRGPMSPTALAEDQNVQGPPMSRIIGALVEAGLARREEHPTDGRQVVVSVTEAGMVEVTETRRRRNVWLEARLAELTPADRETLARAALLLDRIATQ